MVFSSPVFLYVFFPLTWLIHALIPEKYRNIFLLIASLLFYFYGERVFISLMLLTIGISFVSTDIIIKYPKFRFSTAFYAIVLNLSILSVFKYAYFFSTQLNYVLTEFSLSFPVVDFHLPVGISFFTFQAISCIIDVYRKPEGKKASFVETALYISFFPQLIAGPILRYNHFIPQLKNRMVHYRSFLYGAKRFVYGLSKKILIANTLSVAVDKIFLLNSSSLSSALAWSGALMFTFQIYFDFSGYSDMAIGLGRMFGVKIPENFNYPLISRSVTEFWRRWHISLSTWFRDYLYIPLGGNRKGKIRMYLNLWIVFFICGLWHGASWNFVAFGMFHGFVLVIEKLFSLKRKLKIPGVIRIGYTFFTVVIIFIVFRTESLNRFLIHLQAMFIYKSSDTSFFSIIDGHTAAAIASAVIFMFPVHRFYGKYIKDNEFVILKYFETVLLFILFAFSISNSSMLFADPFIYFRF